MALDMMVDSTQLDGALTATADAIRGKTGGTDKLTWDMDKGFAAEIAAIAAGGASSGVAVESGEYTPSSDIRQLDIAVSQAAHDGCLLMVLLADEEAVAGLENPTNTLLAMQEVCIPALSHGEINGFRAYAVVRSLYGSTPAVSTSANNYTGGPSVDGSTVRFAGGSALSYMRAGVTYRWYVYYTTNTQGG